MPAPKICRICLASHVKLFKYDRFELKKYYEQVMGLKVNEKESLPRYFCYECAAMLHKFHKFKEKCQRGQHILKDLLRKGPITITSVLHVDRQAHKLQSSINIISVNRRVRTYLVKQKPKLQEIDEIYESNEQDTRSVSEDDYVDDYDEKDDVPPLPELVDVEEKIEDEEDKIDNEAEKIENKEQKIECEVADIHEEKVDVVQDMVQDNLIDIEKVFTDDERLLNEEEKAILDNIKIDADIEEELETEAKIVVQKKKKGTKGSKKKKKIKDNAVHKVKKFENSKKKRTELDPKNWLKFNLNEEEAIEEFKARALHKRYISAEFKCHDCLKGFSKEDMLNRHIKLRHNETLGSIECRFCRMRFKWKCMLSKHMVQHYTKFKCLRCDLVCPLEQTALFHEEYHNGVIRKCGYCDQEFKHLTTYYTHLRTHRSEHVCTLCGASFVGAIGLSIHKKIKHINSDAGVTEGTQSDEVYCKRCDIKFETKKAYEEHLKHSAMHVEGIEDLEQQGLGTNPKKRKSGIRIRRIPTDCHICGKHFATQAACRKHHLAEHPRTSFFAPNERHICEICGVSLAPTSVASHLNTHTREKLYSCSTCGKQFNSKGGMTTHQLTHTSEKPVPCTLCDKRFKQSSSMKLHYRTFHLKEPYPKRNRKKKIDEVSKLDDYPHEESDDNMTIDRWR